MKATEIHMYGFDALFDMNIESFTDLLLESDRGANNTHRLATTWRKVWQSMFAEFPDVQFNLHHPHNHLKFPKPENVNLIIK